MLSGKDFEDQVCDLINWVADYPHRTHLSTVSGVSRPTLDCARDMEWDPHISTLSELFYARDTILNEQETLDDDTLHPAESRNDSS